MKEVLTFKLERGVCMSEVFILEECVRETFSYKRGLYQRRVHIKEVHVHVRNHKIIRSGC